MPVAFEYSPMLEMLCNNGLIVSDAHLAAAATKGCSDALAILLDNDRRPMEDRLPGLREAFGLASENGWPECRELMLRRFEDLKDVDISVGLKAASDRHDPNALHTILGLGAQDDGSALQSACETANEETARQLLQAQSYSTHQLNLALEAYFNSVNDANMRRYQVRRVESAIQSRTSLYQTFKFTSTFGLTMEGKYAVLDMLSKRGARVSESLFIKAFAVVVPMDEDFAAYLLDNMGTLQDGCGLRSGDFLTLACLWGRERLVRGMLERPDSEILGDGIGISPIDAAEASGNAALVEFLLSRNASDRSLRP
ncbi:hypothetical protein B0T11DRAFT_72102 [Plectosphaerella cucumerina]|uniref:Ankyrin repeat protein n=1 Tax=Plectosphaerella cucumerina TaxID=40658 RepID=A0A8K0X843_9PEZI|nr:hypothetical protein B0T11DRAFT_72102 [Plectosphaerella cucumerina]